MLGLAYSFLFLLVVTLFYRTTLRYVYSDTDQMRQALTGLMELG